VGYKPRSEYATEEEWQAAKSRQETLPKAAFQFGVKMADGRKSQGKLGKGKTDQKINNELQKIQARAERAMRVRAAEHCCHALLLDLSLLYPLVITKFDSLVSRC